MCPIKSLGYNLLGKKVKVIIQGSKYKGYLCYLRFLTCIIHGWS